MVTKINQMTGMPKLATALRGWESTITLEVITESVDADGLIVNVSTPVTFKGTIQPLTAEQIQLKPEGQRSWEWLQIHSVAGGLNLKTNDRITYNGVEFKVMGVYDYTLNAFIEYHVIKDYQN